MNSLSKIILYASICLSLSSCITHENFINNYVNELLIAHELDQKLPHVSNFIPNANTQEIYTIQKNYVKKLLEHETINGFKSCYISHNANGLEKPVFSVLFKNGKKVLSDTLSLYGHVKPLIDICPVFIVKEKIDTKLRNIKEVKSKIASCYLGYRITDLKLVDLQHTTTNDFIAANTIHSYILLGNEIPFLEEKNIHFSSKLYKENEFLALYDYPNDPKVNAFEDLLWLINMTIEQGYTIEKDMLLAVSGKADTQAISKGTYLVETKDYASQYISIAD